MFTFVKTRIVKNWPAVARVATDDGEVIEAAFALDLELVKEEQYRSLVQGGDAAVVTGLVKGFSGIKDESGKELAFNAKNMAALATDPAFVRAVLRAYNGAINGEAARKNS
ncbi:hypothetical protein [Gallaecimonas mangrovi]|uniref:hypothetical protein n=1 Tax=Gallaecimonas mangrovi TaxID=2291597 RepID=UPI000E202895|nr:hypothetical protein [Gallaecimonas mangrovi]